MDTPVGYLRDPVLRLLPDEPPRAFLLLPYDEQRWRGRFFLVTWILQRDEQYAWALALAEDPDGESRRAISTVSDQQIVDDLALIGTPGSPPPEPLEAPA